MEVKKIICLAALICLTACASVPEKEIVTVTETVEVPVPVPVPCVNESQLGRFKALRPIPVNQEQKPDTMTGMTELFLYKLREWEIFGDLAIDIVEYCSKLPPIPQAPQGAP